MMCRTVEQYVGGRGACIVFALAVIFACLPARAVAERRRLNNLVTELAHCRTDGSDNRRRIEFTNPRSGWVFVGCTPLDKGEGRCTVLLNGMEKNAELFHIAPDGPGRGEAMRFLPAGPYVIELDGDPHVPPLFLVVRAMPETQFVRYPQEPRFPALGHFDWAWLDAHVLSSVNTVVGYPSPKIDAAINAWTGRGRRFLAYGGLPHQQGLSGQDVFSFWKRNPGFSDKRLGGLIADEFQGRQHPLYPAWIEGMRLLGEASRGTGHAFYAYCGGPGMYTRPETRKLVRTVFDAGFYMAWERYHHEMPTRVEALALMDRLLGKEMRRWQRVFPACQRQMVLVLGIFATGPDIDVQPQVNYKVWMDMQMCYLATHPRFDGLYGVQWWYSGGANEELLRWQNALYRHYCIEGATELLSARLGWTYALDHLRNPDFYDGLDSWQAEPAAEGSIGTGYLERYARIENRYWQRQQFPDDPAGNTYLWTRRTAERPNTVSQEVRGLIPGSVYTVQMISADYDDIVHGRSEKKRHAVRLTVEGAQTIDVGSYHRVPQSSSWSHPQLPFKNGPAWFNHHRVMFRATAPVARVTISDWLTDDGPGGPVGQKLMFNYLQLQPYFEQMTNASSRKRLLPPFSLRFQHGEVHKSNLQRAAESKTRGIKDTLVYIPNVHIPNLPQRGRNMPAQGNALGGTPCATPIIGYPPETMCTKLQ